MLKAHYLNYRHVSSDTKLIAKAELLATQYRAAKQQLRKNNRDFSTAFNVILTNVEVYQAYDGWCLQIPTDNNLFSGKTKRNATYTTEIRDALRWLIEEGFLVKAAGLTRPKKKGSDERNWLPFSYKLSSKWLAEIAAAPLSDPSLIHRNPLVEYWLLRKTEYVRGKKKKFAIEPTDEQLKLNSAMLETTNQTLSAYDDFMATVATTIGSSPVHPSQLSLTRIFSKASFELGGRLFAPIQNYTKQTRKYFYLNGEPTIEIDYSSIHPHMLYHRKGLEFDGDDPYAIEGFDRDAVKVAFNIMLNKEAFGANKSVAKTIRKVVDCDIDTAEALEAAIQALHSPIAHHFNTGVGLTLQRRDSDIALLVINTFVNELNRPIICVHDSFIVSVRDTESLILAMNDSYKAVHKNEEDATKTKVMKGIKGVSLDFSDALTTAIEQCFQQDTDTLTDSYWAMLLAAEEVHECDSVGVEEEEVEEL
ncbi:hypothetical protein N9Q59_01685 [Gammaproteobacteria bacterium]|nr:hypothetical protein [Gammaproteobacteria bacterium]MDC1511467.1 hypothetical protein [Gammaproteobacteria bacterium]